MWPAVRAIQVKKVVSSKRGLRVFNEMLGESDCSMLWEEGGKVYMRLPLLGMDIRLRKSHYIVLLRGKMEVYCPSVFHRLFEKVTNG